MLVCTLFCALVHTPEIESFDVGSGVTKGGLLVARKDLSFLWFPGKKGFFQGPRCFSDSKLID